MRKRRTIYFNDARHYYLFVHEPPISLEQAREPVDSVAGTGVNTFAYGVSRGDGLFYPSEVGTMFGADRQPFEGAYEWRTWQNMQSLIARGLDPLTVLVERAHERGMDFVASLRMGSYAGMTPEQAVAQGGRGFADLKVRDHQFAVLEELVTRYPVEGVELDFSSAPGGSPFWLRAEDVAQHTSTMTDFVRESARMARAREGEPCLIGARVYPTEELNIKTGLDVQTWLSEGLVDFVVPMLYLDFIIDTDMPVDWLVESAHRQDIAVYGMLQPYRRNEDRRFHTVTHASAPEMRAAAANLAAAGVDGLCTWFLPWPLGKAERERLTELSDPSSLHDADKVYYLRRRCDGAEEYDYPAWLPLEIPLSDVGKPHDIPFTIADDTASSQISSVRLQISVSNLVAEDRFVLSLNGTPLPSEPSSRSPIRTIDPYAGQTLVYDLTANPPLKGSNHLTFCLERRPEGLEGSIVIEDIDIAINYRPKP